MAHTLTLITAAAGRYPEITWDIVKEEFGEMVVVSSLMIMSSAAGYYLGRWCVTITDGEPQPFLEPYSRETDYYPSEDVLKKVYAAEMMPVRDCPENNALYDSGALPFPGK